VPTRARSYEEAFARAHRSVEEFKSSHDAEGGESTIRWSGSASTRPAASGP
jgi:hypothetical protein